MNQMEGEINSGKMEILRDKNDEKRRVIEREKDRESQRDIQGK